MTEYIITSPLEGFDDDSILLTVEPPEELLEGAE